MRFVKETSRKKMKFGNSTLEKFKRKWQQFESYKNFQRPVFPDIIFFDFFDHKLSSICKISAFLCVSSKHFLIH